jgi:hypothetical protein
MANDLEGKTANPIMDRLSGGKRAKKKGAPHGAPHEN